MSMRLFKTWSTVSVFKKMRHVKCRHVLLCVQLTYIYFTIHTCVTRVTITWPVVTPMCHTTTIATLVRLTWFNNLTTSSTETWILHTHKINLHTRTSSWLISLLVHGNIDTRESITLTAELWNRWIRLSCYYNRVYSLGHCISM